MNIEIINNIKQAFNQAFETNFDNITIDTTPEDIEAWDSLGHATLISELESILRVSFEIDEIMEMEDVATIYHIIDKKISTSD